MCTKIGLKRWTKKGIFLFFVLKQISQLIMQAYIVFSPFYYRLVLTLKDEILNLSYENLMNIHHAHCIPQKIYKNLKMLFFDNKTFSFYNTYVAYWDLWLQINFFPPFQMVVYARLLLRLCLCGDILYCVEINLNFFL